MNTPHWFDRLIGVRPHPRKQINPRRRRRTQLHVERLEPRCVPTFTTLASFNFTDGYQPNGVIEDGSGDLFGSAYSGGNGLGPYTGTLFELPQGSSATATLANSFIGSNNLYGPIGSLAEDSSGNLYGTVLQSFGNDYGGLFELPVYSNTPNDLGFTLDNNTGIAPRSGLIEDSSGNMFGTMSAGGSFNDGTVFELYAGGSGLATLAVFTGGNGASPEGPLVEDSSGNLFGTTFFGGASNVGTVFELANGAGTITSLASFNNVNGAYPSSGLILDKSGNLFGTTNLGGPSDDGTVFELQKGSGTITTLVSFNGSDGAHPSGGVVQDSPGNLFGTTADGGSQNGGTVFEIPAGSGSITVLENFPAGSHPSAPLLQDSFGDLFGTTAGDGTSNYGTIFEVWPAPVITTTSLPDWTVNQPGYFQVINSTHGAPVSNTYPPFNQFSVTSGTLPPGLILNNAGGLSGTPTATGTFTFTVTATDAAGATGSYTYTVTIRPQPAIITPSLASWTVNQPGYNQFLATFGGISPYAYTISAGTLPPGLTFSTGGDFTGKPTTSGTTFITVTATDSVGASTSNTYALVINPPVSMANTTLPNGDVGVSYSQPLSASGGTGTLSFSAPPGGVPPGLTLSSTGVISGTPTSAGLYTFTVTATDTTGASGSGAVTLAIGGVPTKLAFAMQPVSTPTGITLPAVTVDVLDAFGNLVTTDNSDVVTLAIASGPPGAPGFTASSTTTAAVHNGVASFTNLMIIVPGPYTLSESVPTLLTGPNSGLFSVLPLRVASTSFTPTGFTLQFTTAFLVNSLTPVLYGQTSGGPPPVPSVTLTQTKDAGGNPVNIPIAGSLVLNTANNSATFVPTDTSLEHNNSSPILPDGTYTVVVHSSAANDGFQALNPGGGFLDGPGTGTPGSGDYTRTFSVNATAMKEDVVWIPATADGPGEQLNAPGNNQVGGGYPVYLDSTGGVTNIQLNLAYDPSLLTVTGATGAGFSFLFPSFPGHARFQYAGPALAAGTKTLVGYITASVPSGSSTTPTPYKAKDLLQLGVSLNGGTVTAIGSESLHLVAYVGDADGNGSYSANDAVLITRALLGTDTGFAAYPLLDPVVVADTDGAGFIPADAALQANEAGVGYPTADLPIPPIPSGVVFQPIANNVDPTLSIPSYLQVGPDGTVRVPVNIDDAHPAGSSGLIEAHLALRYNPDLFTVSAADVHLGTVLAGGNDWTMAVNIDQATGEIGIALSSTTPISTSGGGSLVTIDFHSVGRIAYPLDIALVAAANPNGQDFTTELEDAQGTFTITSRPTNFFC